MKTYIKIIILLFITVHVLATSNSSYKDNILFGKSPKTSSSFQGDSIMRLVIQRADTYKTAVSQYNSEIYIKGKSEILKQNFLMRFAHHLFPVNRKNIKFYLLRFQSVAGNRQCSFSFFTDALNISSAHSAA